MDNKKRSMKKNPVKTNKEALIAESQRDRLLYVYTEYCPGNFFWGWWLYAVPVIEGKPMRNADGSWIRDMRLREVLQAIGLPVDDWRSPKTYEAFMSSYPNGVLIHKANSGYSLVSEQGAGVELWRFLQNMRESQLLDWKNADRSYLAWVESQKKKQEAQQLRDSPTTATRPCRPCTPPGVKPVKGDQVILSRVTHEEYRGQIGIITKTIKSKREAIIKLNSGASYRANIENVDIHPAQPGQTATDRGLSGDIQEREVE